MTTHRAAALAALAFALLLGGCAATGAPVAGKLDLVNARSEVVTYRGRRALHLAAPPGSRVDSVLAIAETPTDFTDGTIEVDLAGVPLPDEVAGGARGFIGVAFRVEPGERSELIYLRPDNGRAPEQLRRNHATQYEALPDWPWNRLRGESPGVYESYVDLETGAWTHVKVVVAGRHAELYVDGAAQPCLVVNDLKHGPGAGRVALWSHVTTDAYFANLRVTPAP